MRFASALSTASRTPTALDAAIASVTEQLQGPATWAAVFASAHHEVSYPEIGAIVGEALGGAVVFGSSAGGVIAAGCEVEDAPGLSIVAASMPGAEAHVVALGSDALPATGPLGLADHLGVPLDEVRGVIVLPDPFSVDTLGLLARLDAELPDGVPVVGGQVSGGTAEGGQALFCGDRVLDGGLVLVAFTGDVHVQTVVAQGCRPVGSPMFVTDCAGSRVRQLDGRSAVEVLGEVYQDLDEVDRALFQREVFLGVQMQDQTEYAQGDFLIRHVNGVPREDETALAVAFRPERFQVVQVHLRDAATSAADLQRMLRRWAAEPSSRPPCGALLFQCLGRGADLYGEPDHDARMFLSELGSVPMGGFFCNGEIGPVHGRTHLHGYTSVFALFS